MSSGRRRRGSAKAFEAELAEEKQDITDVKRPKTKGRPRKDIDRGLVLELAEVGCTMEQIAAVSKCSVDTLERNFADAIKTGRFCRDANLVRTQYQVATGYTTADGRVVEPNTTMLIWLGKQYLGQKDKVEARTDGSITVYPKEYIEAVNRALGYTGELRPIGLGSTGGASGGDSTAEGGAQDSMDVLPE